MKGMGILVPERIVSKSTNLDTTGQSNKASDTPRPKTPVSAKQIHKKSNDAVLKKLSADANTSSSSKQITVEDLNILNAKRSTKSLRDNSMTALTATGATASVAAGLSKMFLGEKSPLSTALDKLTDTISSASFSGFGAFGTSDSVNRKNPLQLAAQALAVIVPLVGPSEDLTMLRRPEVGLANIAADMEKLSGKGKKEGYSNFTEGMDVFVTAGKKYLKAMKDDPIKALFDYESGTAGINAGILTSASLIPYLLGAKKLGSVMGQGAGMAVEFASKFNADNLKKGRLALFASGALMTGSSFLNMVKEFLPEKMHKAIENGTWALNLFGKQAQLQAYNNGELALTENQEFKVSELPGKMLKAILGSSDHLNSVAEPVIGNAHEEALVQTKKTKSGSTQYSVKPSYVRNSISKPSFQAPKVFSPSKTSSSEQVNVNSAPGNTQKQYPLRGKFPSGGSREQFNSGLSARARYSVDQNARTGVKGPTIKQYQGRNSIVKPYTKTIVESRPRPVSLKESGVVVKKVVTSFNESQKLTTAS